MAKEKVRKWPKGNELELVFYGLKTSLTQGKNGCIVLSEYTMHLLRSGVDISLTSVVFSFL